MGGANADYRNMTTIIRPGQRIVNIPGIGLRVSRRAVSSGAVNWWEAGGATGAVAVYQPKGATSLATSYVNLATPGTYDAAPGTAPTWAAGTGWGFDGSVSSRYLTTGVIPSAGYTILVRFSDAASGGVPFCVAGSNAATTTTRFFMHVSHSSFGDDAIWGGGGVYTTYGSAIASGVMALADRECYVNGSAVGTTNAAWSGTSNQGIAIGARNTTGTINEFFSGNVQACAIYNTALTAPQVAAVSAAMAAL